MAKVEKKTEKKPFFARFLEGQPSNEGFPKVKSKLRAGRKLPETMKYPSDSDEW